MVNVKEDIAGFFGFENAAAEQPAADDLEGINERILDEFQLKLGQLFNMDIRQVLGRVFLDQLAVFVPREGGQQGGVVGDSLFHSLRHLFHVEEILVDPHHREEVVHRGIRRIELIVYHIQLLGRQRMRCFESFIVLFLGADAVVLREDLCIKLGDLRRRSAAEYLGGVQSGQICLGDQLDRAQRVAAHFVEVVVDADTGELQNLFHRVTELFFDFVRRGDVIVHEVGRIRLRQRFSVELAVRLQRNLVYLDVVGGDHVVGETLHQLLTHEFAVDLDVVGIISAEIAFISVFKAARSSPADAESLLDRRLDLGGFDTVAVDLDHIAAASEQDKVAVFILLGKVAGMINAVDKGFFGFFRQVDVTAHIGILEAQLAGLAFSHLAAFLADEIELGFYLRLTDRTGLIGTVDREHADGKAAFACGIDVDKLKILVVNDEEHPEERTCLIAQLTDVGGRQEGDGDTLGEEEFRKRDGIFDGGVGDDKGLAAGYAQRLQNNDDRSDEVQRRKQRKAVGAVKGGDAVDLDGFDGAVQVAVFVQHALGVACGTRGVDRVGGVVLIRRFKAGKRLGTHDLIPVLSGNLQLAAAVRADIADALGSIGILYQRPCGAGFPDTDHRDDRKNAAGQIDEDKILTTDAALFEIGVYAGAHIVQLRVGDSPCMCFVEKNG